MIHARASDTIIQFLSMSYLYFASIYPADFIRNPIKTPQPGPGRGPRGFRRPGRRPGGAGHGEAVASGLSSAGDLRCLGRLVSEQYDFSKCWKRYCCYFYNIYNIYYIIMCVFLYVSLHVCVYARTCAHMICVHLCLLDLELGVFTVERG